MKRYIFVLSLALSAATITSCADMLEQEPANNITTEQIDELLESGDMSKIKLVIGGIANGLPMAIHRTLSYGGSGNDARVNSPLRLHYYNSLLGYDIVCGAGVEGFGYDAYRSVASRESASALHNNCFWYFGWSCVASANKMLYYYTQYVPDTLNDNELKDYKARALTLRAYGYNFLMENYRDAYKANGEGLMLYDKITPKEYDNYKPLTSAQETYDFIKKDLNEAVQLFAESRIGDNGYTPDTKDIDLAVANFVLARVSLLTGDYDKAIAACDSILGKYPNLIAANNYGGKNDGTSTAPKFVAEKNAFVKFGNINPEVIFGFPGVNTNQNVATEWLNVFGGGYGGAGANWGRIVKPLYEAINSNDVRKGAFLDANNSFANYEYPTTPVVIQTIPSYSNLKFAANEVTEKRELTNLANLDVCYMRASEVLLMKAEAQANNNNESGAKETLNVLLAARTVPQQTPLEWDTYGGANTVLDQIKLQWRIEMWGENGLEYYNNKRWGNAVTRVGEPTDNHWDKSVIPVSLMKWAFPTNESIFNPNLQ